MPSTGLRRGGVGAGEGEQGGEVAAAIVVIGVHGAAQDQQAVMLGGVRRHIDAGCASSVVTAARRAAIRSPTRPAAEAG